MSHDCFGREPCGERYCRRCNTFKQDDDDDDDDNTPTPEEHMPATPAPRLGDTVYTFGWADTHLRTIPCRVAVVPGLHCDLYQLTSDEFVGGGNLGYVWRLRSEFSPTPTTN